MRRARATLRARSSRRIPGPARARRPFVVAASRPSAAPTRGEMGGGSSGPGLSAASHARNFHFPAEGVGLQPAAPSPPAILSPRKDGAAGSPRRAGKGFPRPGREIRPLPPTPRRGTGSAPAATPPRRAPRGAAGESPPSSSPPRCQPLGVTAPGRGEKGGGVKGGETAYS